MAQTFEANEQSTKSVFSEAADNFGQMEENYSAGEEAKRKRRQKPKQEPLAYAFRGGQSGSGKQKGPAGGNLGSDYTLIQTHPVQQHQHQHQQQNHNHNQNTRPNGQQAYQTGGPARPMGANKYQSGGKKSNRKDKRYKQRPQKQHYPQRHQQQQQQQQQQHQYDNNNGNTRPPFGMPVMRTPMRPNHPHPAGPARGAGGHNQMYQMASSPALTMESVLQFAPPPPPPG